MQLHPDAHILYTAHTVLLLTVCINMGQHRGFEFNPPQQKRNEEALHEPHCMSSGKKVCVSELKCVCSVQS